MPTPELMPVKLTSLLLDLAAGEVYPFFMDAPSVPAAHTKDGKANAERCV